MAAGLDAAVELGPGLDDVGGRPVAERLDAAVVGSSPCSGRDAEHHGRDARRSTRARRRVPDGRGRPARAPRGGPGSVGCSSRNAHRRSSPGEPGGAAVPSSSCASTGPEVARRGRPELRHLSRRERGARVARSRRQSAPGSRSRRATSAMVGRSSGRTASIRSSTGVRAPARLRRHDVAGGDAVQQRHGVLVRPEGRPPLERGVQRGAEGEHVGGRGRLARPWPPPGRGRRGAGHHAGGGERDVAHGVGDPEVGDLRGAVRRRSARWPA